MVDDPRVDELLEELLDTDRTPEEICRANPELLSQVRAGWQRIRALQSEADELCPGSDPAADQPVGKAAVEPPRVPGYDVGEELGRGGIGIVYKAWHRRLNRPVALKMLLAGPYARPRELEWFLREAEAVAGLAHRNVVQVHDAGGLDGRPAGTAEVLRKWVRRRPGGGRAAGSRDASRGVRGRRYLAALPAAGRRPHPTGRDRRWYPGPRGGHCQAATQSREMVLKLVPFAFQSEARES
jgi:hypothetical protein